MKEPQLHLQDTKLLIAGRQKGEQAPHFDRDDDADNLKQVYSVVLYLTDGVDSTAFPQFLLDEFAVPEYNADDEVQNAQAMRATVQRGLLNKEHYDRWPVCLGDMRSYTRQVGRGEAEADETGAGRADEAAENRLLWILTYCLVACMLLRQTPVRLPSDSRLA